jgi:hypothetical protein
MAKVIISLAIAAVTATAVPQMAKAVDLPTPIGTKIAVTCPVGKSWISEFYSQGVVPSPSSPYSGQNSYQNFGHAVQVKSCVSNSKIRYDSTGVASSVPPTYWMKSVYAIANMSNILPPPSSPANLFKSLRWSNIGSPPSGAINRFTISGTALNPVVNFYFDDLNNLTGDRARTVTVLGKALRANYAPYIINTVTVKDRNGVVIGTY